MQIPIKQKRIDWSLRCNFTRIEEKPNGHLVATLDPEDEDEEDIDDFDNDENYLLENVDIITEDGLFSSIEESEE